MNYSFENTRNTNANYSVQDCSLPVAHGVALITTNALVCLLGTLGNLLVCVVIATNPRLRRNPNFLLFSLAVADLIVTMVCEPLVVAILAKKTFFNECATSLELPFQILSRLSCSSSVIHMAAISVDRFIAVVFPLHHMYIMESYGLKTMLIASWTVPILVPVLNRFVPQSFPKAFLGLGMFGLCYLIIVVSYLAIVISLLKHKRETNRLGLRSSSNADSRVEVRVALTLAIVIAVFTACWIPFFVVFMVTGKLLLKRYGTAYMWIRTLALSNSAMNFLIYGSKLNNFHEGFALICRKAFGILTRIFSRTMVYHVN